MVPILVMRGFYRIDYLVSIADCTGEIPCMSRLCRVQPQLTRRSAVSLPSSVRENKWPYTSEIVMMGLETVGSEQIAVSLGH